jgi:hypothetical protein
MAQERTLDTEIAPGEKAENKRTQAKTASKNCCQVIFVTACGSALIASLPMEGVEPTHCCQYQILSLARLPIPPHRHVNRNEKVARFSATASRFVPRCRGQPGTDGRNEPV